jgi:putative salt-induced outer membrane protein YdiY
MNILRTTLLMVTLCAGYAGAQTPPPIQIPSAPQSSGSSQADGQWRGLAGASFSSSSGNSSSNNLLLNIDMARKTEMDKISAMAMANYGSSRVMALKLPPQTGGV